MDIVLRNVDELIKYKKNARVHSSEQISQIADSIKNFGFNDPIEIGKDSILISGHARLEAAKKLGIKEVPTIIHDHMTPMQRKGYILAANRIAMSSTWDNDILKLELEDLQSEEFDLLLTGFYQDEIDLLLNPEELNEGLVDADECSEVDEENVVSKLGDVWILGKHRLMCGDSTMIDSVEKLMNGQKADMLITDPPYNVNYEGKTKDSLKIQNDSMSDSSFRQFLTEVMTCANIVMKEGAVFYIWHADSEGYNFRGACQDVGWKIRQCLIWVKSVLVMGRQDYHWKHEPCLYGWKEGASHYWGNDRKQTTVLQFDKPTRNDIHPTMKPVDLIEYQVKNNSKANNLILDLFGGSGSTLIACEKLGRKCFMMELDPKYVDVIIRRWMKFTGKKAIHEETGVEFNAIC